MVVATPAREDSPQGGTMDMLAAPGPIDPREIGISKCIVDTGCGHNLLPLGPIERTGNEDEIERTDDPVTLQTAGGLSACRGEVNLLTPSLDEGEFRALVMPNTPPVLSVGERCLDHGYGFHWHRGADVPYLETPSGKKIRLTVQGKIPYLDVSAATADDVEWVPGCPGAAGSSNDTMRFVSVAWKATRHLDAPDRSATDGPPLLAIKRRVTLDMHTRQVLGETEIKPDMTTEMLTGSIPDGPRDLLVYWYYDPSIAAANGWQAVDVLNGSSGGGPKDAPRADQGPAGGDEPPAEPPDRVVDPADQVEADELERPVGTGRTTEELKAEARSLSHLLTHLPKNRYCPTCMQAKAQPPPQRQERNKPENRSKRPPARTFGDEVTCDHWFAANDVSRGLHGESVALTLRDRATNWVECQGMKSKSTDQVTKFLANTLGPTERWKYFYTDGAAELGNAIDAISVARDITQPENKRQNARAERSNRHMEEGIRSMLLHAGMPNPFWPYAARYFALVSNFKTDSTGTSAWLRRHGEPFLGILAPFGALVQYIPPKESKSLGPKTGPRAINGIFLGYMRHAGGRISEDYLVMPLSDLNGIDHDTGRVQDGERPPTIERSNKIIWNAEAPPVFPLKEAFDKAKAEIAHVTFSDEVETKEIGARESADDQGDEGEPPEEGGESEEPREEDDPVDPELEGEPLPAPLDDDDEPGEYRIGTWDRRDKKAKNFVLGKVKDGPCADAILARSVQNMDTGEFYEIKKLVVGRTMEDLLGPLPLEGRKKSCDLLTTLYFDPDFKQPRGYFVDGVWQRRYKNSRNPGILAAFWADASEKQRDLLIAQYQAEKKGVYADPPKLNTGLLEQIGVKQPAPKDPPMATPAEAGPAQGGPPSAAAPSETKRLIMDIKFDSGESQKTYESHGFTQGYQGDAGLDLRCIDATMIGAGGTKLVPLGIKCKLHEEGSDEPLPWTLMPRSSIAKTKFRQANSVGLIDPGYRGQVYAALDNRSDDLAVAGDGLCVVQAVAMDGRPMTVNVVTKLADTDRGSKGFGSTDSDWKCYTRTDKQAKRLVTTDKKGPKWEHVHRRVTMDAITGKILAEHGDCQKIKSNAILYAPVPDGPRDIVTKLYHDDPTVNDELLTAVPGRRVGVPRMPLAAPGSTTTEHRPHIPDLGFHYNPFMDLIDLEADRLLQPSAVARSVTKKEAAGNKKAMEAMQKEWDRLTEIGTWDLKSVREWDSVRNEAKKNKETIHIGRVFPILVEKNSELPEDHPDRKFKGRVVFDGSDVRDQDRQVALFQELSSSPATMQASKAADVYAMFDGNDGEQSDARQAYTQSKLGGKATWVRLPKEAWPPHWEGTYKEPVVRLILSLYGHPDSGGFWEKHCENHLLKQGFETIPSWRSCYWHPALKLLLIVYVDDFKLSGPKGNLATGWKLIQDPCEGSPKGILMDPPAKIGRFLGCEHTMKERSVTWQGELPTILDPPPPKPTKTEAKAAPCREHGRTTSEEGLAVWERIDNASPCLRTTLEGGPQWDQVVRRVTYDTDTGEIIKDEVDPWKHPSDQHYFPLNPPRNIRTQLHFLETSTDQAAPAEPFNFGELGCDSWKEDGAAVFKADEPRKVKTIEYDMGEFFASCVKVYSDLTGHPSSAFPKVGTPFGPELPGAEDGVGGPAGFDQSPADVALAACLGLEAVEQDEDHPVPHSGRPAPVDDRKPPTESGVLQPIAARVLMKILYGARMARPDLLRAVCHAASCVTKWTVQNDHDLFRLVCYINSTLDYKLTSWVGARAEDLKLTCYADADFAGDMRTQRSTSGNVLMLTGPRTKCILSSTSRRQTCVSHSTPEAEIVSADLALRTEALPASLLWGKILGRNIEIDFMEDNQAVVKICKAGGSQRMAHLPRTHRIDAAAVSEQFIRGVANLTYCRTQDQAADIGTKRFSDPSDWVKVIYLINIVKETFWDQPTYLGYMKSLFDAGLPMKPGGIVKPTVVKLAEPTKKFKKKREGKQERSTPQADQTKPKAGAPGPEGPPTTKSSWENFLESTGKHQKNILFIEYCCSEKSRMGSHALKESDVAVLRLTEEIDMTLDSSFDMVIQCIRGWPTKNVYLAASIPCTGGSPWQRVNKHVATEKGDQAALDKLKGHWTLFRKLWKNFEMIAQYVLGIGGTITIEWPTGCEYWRDRRVINFMQIHDLKTTDIHGCAYGLKTEGGMYVKKPWSFATNSRAVLDGLGRKCDGRHEHAICRGSICKRSEMYTESLVRSLLRLCLTEIRDRSAHPIACCAIAVSDQAFFATDQTISRDPSDRDLPGPDAMASVGMMNGHGQWARTLTGGRLPPQFPWGYKPAFDAVRLAADRGLGTNDQLLEFGKSCFVFLQFCTDLMTDPQLSDWYQRGAAMSHYGTSSDPSWVPPAPNSIYSKDGMNWGAFEHMPNIYEVTGIDMTEKDPNVIRKIMRRRLVGYHPDKVKNAIATGNVEKLLSDWAAIEVDLNMGRVRCQTTEMWACVTNLLTKTCPTRRGEERLDDYGFNFPDCVTVTKNARTGEKAWVHRVQNLDKTEYISSYQRHLNMRNKMIHEELVNRCVTMNDLAKVIREWQHDRPSIISPALDYAKARGKYFASRQPLPLISNLEGDPQDSQPTWTTPRRPCSARWRTASSSRPP